MQPDLSDQQFGFSDHMADWASDFVLISGFDQEPVILGAGGETADLQKRLFHMSKQRSVASDLALVSLCQAISLRAICLVTRIGRRLKTLTLTL